MVPENKVQGARPMVQGKEGLSFYCPGSETVYPAQSPNY